MRRVFLFFYVWIGLLCTNLQAASNGGAQAPDPKEGERMYQEECARCHGDAGQGGNSGEYPRIAGLPEGYIGQQVRAFRDHKRQNKPMIPIFESGRLQDAHIGVVSGYLAGLPVPSATEVEVSGEPRGDLELGEELYVTDCALCHGLDGRGKEGTDNPPVVQQYARYLIKQLVDFRDGKRWHEYGEQLFAEAEPDELDAMVAYILSLNFVERP